MEISSIDSGDSCVSGSNFSELRNTKTVMYSNELKDIPIVRFKPEVLDYVVCCEMPLVAILNDTTITSIDIDMTSATLSITGTESERIDAAFHKIELAFNHLIIESKEKSKMFESRLRTADRALIKSSLQKHQALAGWSFRSGHLNVCSNSEINVTNAYQAIEEIIREDVYPSCDVLSPAEQTLVADLNYVELINNLLHEGKSVHVHYNDNIKKIQFTFVTASERSYIISALDGYLRSNGKFTAFLQIPLKQLEYKVLKKNTYILNSCTKVTDADPYNSAEIILDQGYCTLKCASLEMLRQTGENFKAILNGLQRIATAEVSSPQCRWMKSVVGVKKLKDIDTLCNTVSTLTSSLGSTSASYHPSVTNGYSLSLGWLFEHWPFLDHYQTILHKLKLVNDDIISMKVDGIIIFAGYTGYQLLYPLSGVIRDGIQVVYQPANNRNITIYVMPVKRWTTSGNAAVDFVDNLRSALFKLAELNSIAISTVCTRKKDHPAIASAELLFGTILDYLSENPEHQLQQIYLVTPNLYRSLGRVYNSMYRKIRLGVGSSACTTETVTMEVSGISSKDVNNAMCKYQKQSQLAVGTADWSSSPLKSYIPWLLQSQIEELKQMAKDRCMDIEINAATVEIKLAGQKVDIDMMKEIIDTQLIKCRECQTFPRNWNLESSMIEIALNKTSDEYNTVQKKFLKSSGNYYQVTGISRVQNRQLYVQYQAHKERVRQDIITKKLHGPGVELERELWHGTDYPTIKKICSQEFNRSFAGTKNAASCGSGVYFATNSAYSADLVSVCPTGDKKAIMLVKVVTGKHCPGHGNMPWPEVAAKGCHSATNAVKLSNTFVIYHDAAAYPEYVVEFDFKRNT